MMPEKMFEKEVRYQTIMNLCNQLLNRGILSKQEYDIAERRFREKYQPVFGV